MKADYCESATDYGGFRAPRTDEVKDASREKPHEREISEVEGLCKNCVHRDNCMYLKNCSGPILHCELHETQTDEPVKRIPRRHEAPGEKTASGPYKGLCTNCENRETCCLPGKREGVWHCEEYR